MAVERERRGGHQRSPSLRVPASRPPLSPPPPSVPPDRPVLRLSVSRGTLGVELDAPFAIGPLTAALPFGGLIGGAIVLRDAAGRLVRAVLPAAGARAPSVTGVRWDAPLFEIGRIVLQARADAPPPALSPEAIRAVELAE